MQAILALEDGTWFRGRSFTGPGETGGEVIFNTGMSGYQEILTDPSYRKQMVCMTYPHMGNYGINPQDMESEQVQVSAFIVKECCRQPSNWRSTISLQDYLQEQNALGLEDIDTRALTKHIRINGAMRGYISTQEGNPQKVVAKAREIPCMEGQNLVQEATPKQPYLWTTAGPEAIQDTQRFQWPVQGLKVVVYDCGSKWNILRILQEQGLQVLAVPAHFSATQVKALQPDAIFLSNGPGDPAALPDLVHNVALLSQDLPIGGICLGHQVLGLALGAQSFKLKFGHHGLNHPVRNLELGKVEISSQNHGFCVDIQGLDHLLQTRINLNDSTLEGFKHTQKPLMVVQYHPEAAPGPHDSHSFFAEFATMLRKLYFTEN
ncbi:MAG: glutamine-hydrolyzing carbamoyl-phosphate synthase small subunit [Thermodesulfobacteriota bacterium]